MAVKRPNRLNYGSGHADYWSSTTSQRRSAKHPSSIDGHNIRHENCRIIMTLELEALIVKTAHNLFRIQLVAGKDRRRGNAYLIPGACSLHAYSDSEPTPTSLLLSREDLHRVAQSLAVIMHWTTSAHFKFSCLVRGDSAPLSSNVRCYLWECHRSTVANSL